VHTLVLSKECGEEDIEPILSLNADGVALSGNINNAILKDKAQECNSSFAFCVPDSVLLGAEDRVESTIKEYLSEKEKGLFLSTEWEVPYSTSVNNLHKVMKTIRGNQSS
jgi:hypothetical protein